jgi:prepilin-type N-terminal cleavage/methylation domain-containing protein
MNRGFTLIELMVVITLIAIVSGVMVAEMSGSLQDALLRSTSRQLIDAFDLASSRAISRNRVHRIHFDRMDGRYEVETRAHGRFSPLKDLAGSEGAIDPRIHLEVVAPEAGERVADSIAFFPDGTAERREIQLRDKDGFGLALRVDPVTARVDVVEMERR